jgi:hypothetical protein
VLGIKGTTTANVVHVLLILQMLTLVACTTNITTDNSTKYYYR